MAKTKPLLKFKCWRWSQKQSAGIIVEAPDHMAARNKAAAIYSEESKLTYPANEVLAIEICEKRGTKR